MKGMATMLPIFCVLLFGLTMGTQVKALDTGNYLSSVFMQLLTPALLPLLTFIISMLLSFATGTSMGTMAIMATIALPMAINMGVSVPLVAGSMFGGSIFGDHSSPISDTTIMSSAGAQCDHVNHVSTQLPYAISVAGISFITYLICGVLLTIGMANPVWVALPLGIVLTIVYIMLMKRATSKKYASQA